MRKRTLCDLPRTSIRASFTLIELLVVIAIIAALMALSASAVIKYLGSQEEANTKATFNKVQSQLNKAWSKVKDQAYKETIPPQYLPGLQALAGNDANATGRVRTLYVKLKLRQAFPMNFAEALNVAYVNPELASWGLPTAVPASPLPALPAYQAYLGKLGITTTLNAQYESSACLLMALQRGVSGAGINPEELTRGGGTGSATLAGGQTIPYLTDAWNQPIYFSRFPTGSTFLNPAGAQPGANDPGDPQGYINSGAWPQALRQSFSALALQQLAPGSAGVALSFKLSPMIASTGQDRKVGFDPVTFALTVNGSDDLFSTP
jgi:prepilin-type N-terminal cleavage/methylation domain-containing protein